MEFLDSLNDNQKKAVLHTEGPVMVIAGAGSGKTKVLTSRITNLLYKGIEPFNILALTFTNKAAKEMKARIGKEVGDAIARNLWMGTFHSIFAKILRIEADKLGFPSNFTIYDTDDSKSLIKTILKEMSLDDKVYKPGLVLNRISSAKNNLVSVASYRKNPEIQLADRQSNKPLMADIYATYQKRLFKSGAMDFDDLLFNTNILLKEFPDVLYKYQEKFKYLLVDEFQDTNVSQYLIIKQLAARRENICVVGDDAQSIYAFRGANIQNILNFKKDYPDVATYKLEQNYRSTKHIVNAANSIIAKNRDQIKKDVWTSNESGAPIRLMRALSDNEEGMMVANQIFEIRSQENKSNADFAILYRTNAQSRSMEEALRRLNIPYRIYGGLSFYQRKEIKDLLAYCRLAINPIDEEAIKRIINYPARGIGQTSVDRLLAFAVETDSSLWKSIENIHSVPIKIQSGTKSAIAAFAENIKNYGIFAKAKDAFEAATHIATSCGILKDLYNDQSPEGKSRYDNIQELLNAIKEFVEDESLPDKSLAAFMQDIALLTDADNKKDDENQDKVTLMTIHAAKGLEFPVVFIVGLEENLFPSQLSINSREELEEERRLFYVALTRAEKKAFISYSLSRYKWGNLIQSEPSRFITEIDPQFIETNIRVVEPATPSSNTESRLTSLKSVQGFRKAPTIVQNNDSFVADDASKLQTGMEVMHQRFGRGKILSIEGDANGKKATVFFNETGEKVLLLQYAKLQILN